MCAERVHPEDPAFQDRWTWRHWARSLLRWPTYVRSPWRKAFFDRYRFCQLYAVGKRVVDIPCGVGWGTSLLERTADLAGVDLSDDAARYAREHYGDKADESLDLVMCLEGIEHVPVEVGTRFVQEAARVLVSGGRLILTNPLPDPSRPSNPYHVHECTLEEIDGLLDPCFRRERREVRQIGGVSMIYYVGVVRREDTRR